MKPPPIPPRCRNYENIGIQSIQPQPSAPFPDTSSCGSGAPPLGENGFDRISMASYHSGPGIYPSDFIIAMELQNEEAAEASSDIHQQVQSINYARQLQIQELYNQSHLQVTTTTATSTLRFKKSNKIIIIMCFLGLFLILAIICVIIIK